MTLIGKRERCKKCGTPCPKLMGVYICHECQKKRKEKPFYPNVEKKGSCRFS